MLYSTKKRWISYGFSNRHLPEGGEGLEVDGLQHVLGGIELEQQHDEDAVVRQLLELSLSHIMVLDQHSNHNT